MSIEFIYPEFEVIRSDSRCIGCRVCEQQCANGVHRYDAKKNILTEDETKCVNCQRAYLSADQSAEDRKKRLHAAGKRELAERHDKGNLQAGRQRRRASVLHGQSEARCRYTGTKF